jgi:hypothetical protein
MSTPVKPPPTELQPPTAGQGESKRVDQHRGTGSLSAVELEYRRSWARLAEELAEVKRRSSIYLAIAITAIAVAGGILAGPILFGTSPDTYSAVGKHLLTRVPLSLLLGVVAFSFLRRHDVSLEKIAYYHNELTNLDYRFPALRQAVQLDDKVALRATLAAFVKTERNFVLKKGESTVELERSRLETQSAKEMMEMVAKMMKQK